MQTTIVVLLIAGVTSQLFPDTGKEQSSGSSLNPASGSSVASDGLTADVDYLDSAESAETEGLTSSEYYDHIEAKEKEEDEDLDGGDDAAIVEEESGDILGETIDEVAIATTTQVAASTTRMVSPYERLVDVTRVLLRQLHIYDIGRTEVTTFYKLPKEALRSVELLRTRLRPWIVGNSPAVSMTEIADGLAELLNQLPLRTIQRIGSNWLYLVRRLPERTWVQLNRAVLDNMPWEGLVANTPANQWAQLSFIALNRAPARFWRNVPFTVWRHIPAEIWPRIEPGNINQMRTRYVRRLRWKEIAPVIVDYDWLPRLRATHQKALPWEDIIAGLRPDVFGKLGPDLLKRIPRRAWRTVSPAQFRRLKDYVLRQLPGPSLRRVSIRAYKTLSEAQLRAIGLARVRIYTKGQVHLNGK